MLLINLSADVQCNPGPISPKFPCGVCSRAVTWSKKRKGIACDDCSTWFHVDCLNMCTAVYNPLTNESAEWTCATCGLPNFSSTLFDTTLADDLTAPDHSLNTTNSSDPGSPVLASSPKPANPKPKQHRALRLLQANLQSLNANKESLWELVDSADPDVLAGSETWLKSHFKDDEFLPPGYICHRKDRADGYGGVIIMTKSNMVCEEVPTNTTAELVATKITTSDKTPLLVISAYRPPSANHEAMTIMSNAIRDIALAFPKATLWLVGDFNLPDIDWNTVTIKGHQNTKAINENFINMTNDLGLEQIVDFNTRGQNILDLFLTNRPTLVQRCEPLPGVSDHDSILTIADTKAKRRPRVRREILLWDKGNLDGLRQDLASFSSKLTANATTDTPVQDIWHMTQQAISDSLKKHVPSKTTSQRFNQPWINTETKRLCRRKKKALKKAHKSNNPNDWAKYRKLKRASQLQCRKTHDQYISGILSDDPKGNPKKLYSYIKSKRNDSSGVSPLRKQGLTHSDPKLKAEILNDQFSSVFTREDLSSMPPTPTTKAPTIQDININTEGVAKLLSKLSPYKAPGPDKIPPRVLKEAANELAPAIALLFQASLKQGRLPAEWKQAIVAPIFKKGDRAAPANYRPISLTSILGKTLEHIICSHIMKHLDLHKLLSNNQHGFRRKRSCESQLIITIQDLALNTDSKYQTDAILLDFSKAFDKVPKERLLMKLQAQGIKGSTLTWIRDFLSGRSQQVAVDGCLSTSAPVLSGVPQGSVLGPLLFLAYINDLPDAVHSTARLFADDTLLYRKIESIADTQVLQSDLASLENWEHDWQMSFNPSKCEVIHITTKTPRNIIKTTYHLHNQPLMISEAGKYLGIQITPKLSWNKHIDTTTKKANNTCAFLRRNIRSCSPAIKEKAYMTLVRPIIEYAAVVWDPHTKSKIDQIEMVQRRAARFVTNNYSRHSSVTAMLQKLQWDNLAQRRARAKVTMLYKITNSLVDIPASDILIPSTRHPHQFITIQPRIDIYKYSYFPSAIKLWNSLPPNFTTTESVDSFKAAVNSHVFKI